MAQPFSRRSFLERGLKALTMAPMLTELGPEEPLRQNVPASPTSLQPASSAPVKAPLATAGSTPLPTPLNPVDPAILALEPWAHPASYFKTLPDNKVECLLCPRDCKVADMERGSCGVRTNLKGQYYTLVYERPVTQHIDPIEKKPLFHYLPGTNAYSIATAGCNVECLFCQNWNISQFRPEQLESVRTPAATIVKDALAQQCRTIAYTYSEPVIFYEYMYDIATAARQAKIGSVMISNGFIMPEPLKALTQVLTGVKVDFKSFRDEFYQQQCHAKLKPVLDSLELLKKMGIWLELVILIIPSLNDSPKEIRAMAKWVHDHLGPDVPMHFSRYHPMYKIQNIPPTPISTLERCWDIVREEGINFAYIGNVPGHKAENTYCPRCHGLVIRRVGYNVIENHLKDGKHEGCGQAIPGVWKSPL
jgi:pyruvate formate lyase activating enzyme